MKILIYGDCHFSTYSSIVRRRGERYSERLNNLIQSINWAENLGNEMNVDSVVCLGDFFDAPNLTAEEITALGDIVWCNAPHSFLVGNHEVGRKDMTTSSAHIFLGTDDGHNVFGVSHFMVEYKPHSYKIPVGHYVLDLCFLPYIFEDERKTIEEYFPKIDAPTRKIIFSHNDIKGLQLGGFVSKAGFDIDDIENNCSLFINGHLHNGSKISDKIINCGNLTGQNFGEDASTYDHVALVLDTDDLKIAVFENPYAFNFYKLDVVEKSEIEFDKIITGLKNNAVLSIRCSESLVSHIKERLSGSNNVSEYRLVIVRDRTTADVKSTKELNSVDHLKMFSDFILKELGTSDVIVSELGEVCQ